MQIFAGLCPKGASIKIYKYNIVKLLACVLFRSLSLGFFIFFLFVLFVICYYLLLFVLLFCYLYLFVLFVSIYKLCPRFERTPFELLLIGCCLNIISGAEWWNANKEGYTKVFVFHTKNRELLICHNFLFFSFLFNVLLSAVKLCLWI